jgi:hypothetical protein
MRRLLLPATAALLLAPTAGAAQDWRTLSLGRAHRGESALRVDVEYGAGRLKVAPGSTGSLYRAQMRYDADVFRPTTSYRDGRLRIALEGGTVRGRNLRSGNLDLALGPDVPLDLELKFGAAEATLELGGLDLRSAKISTGASRSTLRFSRANAGVCRSLEIEVGAARFEATGLGNANAEQLRVAGGVGEVVLDFTGEWRSDMNARVEVGLGALTLRMPKGLGVRIRRGGILSGFDGQGLIRQGDTFVSPDWEDAERRVTINLDAALGSVRVAWVDS